MTRSGLPRRGLLALFALLLASSAGAREPVPQVTAEAAIVIDATTGRVLWQRNADKRMYPASLTKIMTGVLAVMDGDLDRNVLISRASADVGESGIYLEEDETIPLRDLVRATLIWSANDAATASAEAISGSVGAFVDRMNRQAQDWGATRTHFLNPHGLHEDGHYSTARDLATIAAHAMGYHEFSRIVATRQLRITRPEYVPAQTPEDQALLKPGADKVRKLTTRTLANRNRLLLHWSACDGIKTGYTRHAGRCLAASATMDGWRAIAIVLKAQDTWGESRALLEWAFRNWRLREVLKQGQRGWTVPVRDGRAAKVGLQTVAGVGVLVPATRHRMEFRPRVGAVVAPVTAGQVLGAVDVVVDGRVRASVDLAATGDVPLSLWGAIKRFSVPSSIEKILLCMAAGVMLLGAAAKTALTRGGGVASRRRSADSGRARNR